MDAPRAHWVNGKRRTHVVVVGDVTDTTIEQSRERASITIGRIRRGEDPKGRSLEAETTLGAAWTKYLERTDLGRRTRTMYEGMYRRNLQKWAGVTLRTLVMTPTMALDEHRVITTRSGESEADHAMRLLRSIYLYAAKLDTSLPSDRNPCTALKGQWHGDKSRKEASIPREKMAAWGKQLDALRLKSPMRAAFQMLLLRLGCRPTELASASWWQVDFERKVFWIPEPESDADGAKEEPYEVPLTAQAIAEFEWLRENVRPLNRPGRDLIFPSRMSKRGHGRLAQVYESRLSHSSYALRHTHHTIGTRLPGIKEIVLDLCEGRSIKKSGAAGRGYIDTHELGPEIRAAQQSINDEIDNLLTQP